MDQLPPIKAGRPEKHPGEKRAVKTVSIRPITVALLGDLGLRMMKDRKLSPGEVIDILVEREARKVAKKLTSSGLVSS